MNKLFKMENELYDRLQFFVRYIIPAIGVFYLGFANTWKLPYGQEIKDTCILLEAVLQVILGISRYHYKQDEKEQPKENGEE